MQIASNHCIFILHAASQLKNVPLKQGIANDRHDISVLSLSFFFIHLENVIPPSDTELF